MLVPTVARSAVVSLVVMAVVPPMAMMRATVAIGLFVIAVALTAVPPSPAFTVVVATMTATPVMMARSALFTQRVLFLGLALLLDRGFSANSRNSTEVLLIRVRWSVPTVHV